MGLGTAVQYTASNTEWARTVTLDTDNLFTAFEDAGDSAKGKFIITSLTGAVVTAITAFESVGLGASANIGLAKLNNGNVMLAYYSQTNPGALKVYGPTGSAVVGETAFYTADDADNFDIIALDNGNAFITFQDTSSVNLYFRIVSPTGTEVVANTLIETGGYGTHEIGECPNGYVVVAYATSGNQLAIRIYNQAGVSQLSETVIDSVVTLNREYICAAALPNGNILVAWGDSAKGYFKIVTTSGVEVVAKTEFESSNDANSISTAVFGTQVLISYLDGTSTGSLKYTIINQDGTIDTASTEFDASGFYTNAHTNSATRVILTYNSSGHFVPFTVSGPRGTRMQRKLVAASNNSIYWEDSPGSMVQLAASASDLDTNNECALFEAFQKIYVVNYDKFRVVDFTNDKLSTSSINDDVPGRGTIITGGTSTATAVVDFVTATTGAALIYAYRTSSVPFVTGETVTGFDKDGAALPNGFVLNAVPVSPATPHYYTWTPYANDTTNYGTMPVLATLGALYRGRITLSGSPDFPFQWYMARQGNPYDWAYLALDAQAPVAGNNADAGELGDVITALIPHKDDYLLFGGSRTINRLNGDPAAGGRLIEVSLLTGIFGAASWAMDENENLYFLGNGSVFFLPPQVGATPQDLLQELIPDFWSDWQPDLALHRVVMAYDKNKYGILMSRTNLNDGSNTNYWIDTRTKGFFPETYPDDSGVFSAYYYDSLALNHQALITGTNGGYLKEFDESTTNDDTGASTQAIDSSVVFGPMLVAADTNSSSKVGLVSYTTSVNTNTVTSNIFTNSLAEKMVDGIDAGTLNPAISTVVTPTTHPVKNRKKTKGTFLGLRLRNNTASETWGMESIVIEVSPSGRF